MNCYKLICEIFGFDPDEKENRKKEEMNYGLNMFRIFWGNIDEICSK